MTKVARKQPCLLPLPAKTKDEVNQMVGKHIKLISYTINRLWKNPSFRSYFEKYVGSRQDAQSIGTITLYRCCDLYDPAVNKSFASYAINAISKTLWKTCHREGVIKTPGYSKNSKTSNILRELVKKSRDVVSMGVTDSYVANNSHDDDSDGVAELLDAIAELPDEERAIAQLRFGVGGYEPTPTSKIAELTHNNITRTNTLIRRICQKLHSRCISSNNLQ